MGSLSAFKGKRMIDILQGKDVPLIKIACLIALSSFSLFTLFNFNDVILHAQSEDNEDQNNNSKEDDEDKQVYKLRVGQKAYSIKYTIEGGQLVNMTIPRSDILEVFINPTSSGSITLEIPKSMSLLKGTMFDFEDLRIITLDFDTSTKSVKVRGLTQVSNLGNVKESKDGDVDKNLVTSINKNDDILKNSSNNLLTNISLSDLPQTIELVDPGWENYNLTLRAMIKNGNVTYLDKYESGYSGVSDWNPLLMFQVPSVNSGFGLTNIGHLGIVPIKLYKDPDDMMKNMHIWKNIPLYEEVVFRLPNRGFNLIVAEIPFSNGVKGLYGAAFTVDVHESKSDGTETFNEERSQDKKLVVKETKFSKTSAILEDQEFLEAAENIACIVQKGQGFDVCQSDNVMSTD